MAKKEKRRSGGARKYGRNKKTCEAYRQRVGKPRGPGVPGNKSGKNKV
jgi:hypothetical protein